MLDLTPHLQEIPNFRFASAMLDPIWSQDSMRVHVKLALSAGVEHCKRLPVAPSPASLSGGCAPSRSQLSGPTVGCSGQMPMH